MPQGRGPRRIVPIQGRDATTRFRYLSDRPTGKKSINWASCAPSYGSPFRRERHIPNLGGLYLSKQDLGLLGLVGLALTAPLSLAWHGPAAAYFLIGGSGGPIVSSAAFGGGALSTLLAPLAGLIPPSKPQFTSFDRPCSEQYGVNF